MENDIRTYTLDRLEQLAQEFGQPRFRAKQLHEWIHLHHAASYDDMTNLPKAFRAQLASAYPLDGAKLINRQLSQDGTRKYVIQFSDGQMVEAVGMPSGIKGERLTVCLSTQVGCAMACAFCATGKEGFKRNLSPHRHPPQTGLFRPE